MNKHGTEILTPEEAAAHLRIAVETLRRYSTKGIIPARKVGTLWRYRRADLDAYLSNTTISEASHE